MLRGAGLDRGVPAADKRPAVCVLRIPHTPYYKPISGTCFWRH
ncbi:MAG: hypothetical protein ACI8QZ_004371, partial [Chlamydiales bacterium]